MKTIIRIFKTKISPHGEDIPEYYMVVEIYQSPLVIINQSKYAISFEQFNKLMIISSLDTNQTNDNLIKYTLNS